MENLQQSAEQLRDYIKKCEDHHDPTNMIRTFLESAFLDGKLAGLWERNSPESTRREEKYTYNLRIN